MRLQALRRIPFGVFMQNAEKGLRLLWSVIKAVEMKARSMNSKASRAIYSAVFCIYNKDIAFAKG